MAWCGVVWCGVVWCGVVWCGVVWCGGVWCGVVWCGVVWCGLVWCDVVRHGVVWCGVQLKFFTLHFLPQKNSQNNSHHHKTITNVSTKSATATNNPAIITKNPLLNSSNLTRLVLKCHETFVEDASYTCYPILKLPQVLTKDVGRSKWWCGVVWCGVVWCGVVWCGGVWCFVVWCKMM